jgi:hypothetical protein
MHCRCYIGETESLGNPVIRKCGSCEAHEKLGAAIQAAAKDLPNGWQIHVTVERGSGWARLYNPEGVRVDDFDDGDLNLAESIIHGIEIAGN